jgi:division protein CdvB (Snf7/Vps24/ESCRT-III family)
MQSQIEAKRLLIRDFRAKVDELQELLQTYLSGERRTFGQNQAETTEQDIAQLEREVASLQKVILHLERKLSEG